MKPTWKGITITKNGSPNCRCLVCGKEFLHLGQGHFNMRLIHCPLCRQQLWVPRCPNGCPSFEEKENERTS